MDSVYLCERPLASLPYKIPGTNLFVYSLEELSYYIMNNVYFLDDSFECDELCTWITSNIKETVWGLILTQMVKDQVPLPRFIEEILNYVAYCSEEEIHGIVSILEDMESKTDLECEKIRADCMFEKQKYLACIFLYHKLLDQLSGEKKQNTLCGNLWNNLGAAYANLFLFAEAAECFEKAYCKNNNRASLKQCLYAYRCLHDESDFDRVCQTYHLSEIETTEIKNEVKLASRNEKIVGFEKNLENLARQMEEEGVLAQEQINEIINKWKDDYREICRS